MEYRNLITDNRIKELRTLQKLTVRELAKLVDIDHTLVSKHESGDRNITNEHAKKYAQVFKCETHELFIELPDED